MGLLFTSPFFNFQFISLAILEGRYAFPFTGFDLASQDLWREPLVPSASKRLGNGHMGSLVVLGSTYLSSFSPPFFRSTNHEYWVLYVFALTRRTKIEVLDIKGGEAVF